MSGFTPVDRIPRESASNHAARNRARREQIAAERCRWFARCDRPATHNEPHPAFPDGVPCCDRCAAWIEGQS